MDNPPPKNRLYLYPLIVIIGLPILCGVTIVLSTWFQAANNVRVWRQEFQGAMEIMCPDDPVNIVGGQGRVYLDGYIYNYEWISGDFICISDGRVIRCSCNDELDFIDVSIYRDEAGKEDRK